jgi:hypothetical protein
MVLIKSDGTEIALQNVEMTIGLLSVWKGRSISRFRYLASQVQTGIFQG